MKATELRLGNIVQYLCKDELDERKEWYEPNIIDWNDLKVLSEREKRLLKLPPPNNAVKPDYIPIPLTEEILLKCGFKEDIPLFYKDDLGDVFLKKPYNECDYFLVKSIHGSKITSVKYLHQLQNLYFALCDKELEINL